MEGRSRLRWIARHGIRPPSVDAIAAFTLGSVPVAALGFAEGGFFPRSWSLAALGLAAAVIGALLMRREAYASRRAVALLALLTAVGIWIAASLTWTRSASVTVPELERLLVYLTGVGAAAIVIRARTLPALVRGILTGAGTVVIWGLVSYLMTRDRTPDVFQGSFLHRPMGYANAMAIAAVIALLLALGVLRFGATVLERTTAGVLLVPLATALTLTGSRAAWGALVAGVLIALVIAPMSAAALAAWARVLILPAGAALVVSVIDPMDSGIVGSEATRLGHMLLAGVVALTAFAVFPALHVARASIAPPQRRRRARPDRRAARAIALAALLAGVATIALILGAPDFAGDRPSYWGVAAGEVAEHPILGSGAGTYAQTWLEKRPNEASVRDAHSIVVEAMSELGVIGLVLVLALLVAPLVWGARARECGLAAYATGGFAAYALHASVDWDWEMPAVTLAALLCAVVAAVAADASQSRSLLGPLRRSRAAAVAVAAAVLALASHLGWTSLQDAQSALARGDADAAERAARRAERLQPWSVEPLLVEGQAALGAGDRDGARKAFSRSVRQDPNDYRSWLALASVTDGDVATMAILRAKRLNPLAVRSLRVDRSLNGSADAPDLTG